MTKPDAISHCCEQFEVVPWPHVICASDAPPYARHHSACSRLLSRSSCLTDLAFRRQGAKRQAPGLGRRRPSPGDVAHLVDEQPDRSGSLKVWLRCGCRPNAAHIQRIVVCENYVRPRLPSNGSTSASRRQAWCGKCSARSPGGNLLIVVDAVRCSRRRTSLVEQTVMRQLRSATATCQPYARGGQARPPTDLHGHYTPSSAHRRMTSTSLAEQRSGNTVATDLPFRQIGPHPHLRAQALTVRSAGLSQMPQISHQRSPSIASAERQFT